MKTIVVPGHMENLAAKDLRAARKEGYHLIDYTKKGTLELRYAARVYTLKTFSNKPELVVKGTPAQVIPVLAKLYACARNS